MKINMTRTDFLKSGIFGALEPKDESLLLLTLEASYPVKPMGSSSDQVWSPKLPKGTYTCMRVLSKIDGDTRETFEIQVDGHSGLIFAPGNFAHESHGSILLGLARKGNDGLISAENAFDLFMKLQEGEDSFALTVA
jgi:hypothetical protein